MISTLAFPRKVNGLAWPPSGWRFCQRLGVVGLLMAACGCTALPPQAIVIGDVTAEGSQGRTPTREAPMYYAPAFAGYRERGAVQAGTKPPPEAEVRAAVVAALSRQHYLMMQPDSTPDLMLVIWWGQVNPVIDVMEANEDDVAPTEVFLNTREMMALVGAFKTRTVSKSDAKELKLAARDDRYFILVAAYDFAAAKRKERKLLWTARMSTESTGRGPDEIFPLLAASGAAVFGRDTTPSRQDTSTPPKIPTVELAPIELIEVLPEEKKP